MTHQPETPLANTISRLRWGLGAHATGTEALYREGDADYWTTFKARNPELAAKVEDAYKAFVNIREDGDDGPLGIAYYSEHFDRWLAEAAHNQGIYEAVRHHQAQMQAQLHMSAGERPTPLTVADIMKRHRRRGHTTLGEAK